MTNKIGLVGKQTKKKQAETKKDSMKSKKKENRMSK